jgi:3-hydroxyisobutyrate dehydrogenase-like beta-hydroxyacid dehydrogenase
VTGGDPLVVAVLGLGEAGSAIAAGLCAAGAVVRGFDPRVRPGPGITACAGASEEWLRQLADEQAGRAAPGG